MAHRELIMALSLIAAASPVWAANPRPMPAPIPPTENPNTRYCMRVEPVTGSRIETVRCWTREEWVEQGVDVDKDWPREGVRIIG